jgi:tRNA 2-thiouridine synthesizing protein C
MPESLSKNDAPGTSSVAEPAEPANKTLLFVQSQAPHGTLFGQEGLDAIMMGSAFTECAVLFVGDGIYQLLANQDTTLLASRNYSVSYRALADYGVQHLYCTEADLQQRGLTVDDLVVTPQVIDTQALQALMTSYDVILDF